VSSAENPVGSVPRSDYEITVEQLLEQIARRNARLDWLKVEHGRLTREITEKDEALQRLGVQVADKERLIESLAAEGVERASDLEAARAALAERQAQVSDLQQRVEIARHQQEAETASMHQQLAAAHAQHEEELAALRDQLTAAQAEGKATLASLRAHYESALALIAEREAAAAALQRDIDTTRALLAETQTEMARQRSQSDEAITLLRRDVEAARRLLAEREAGLDRVRTELAGHQRVIRSIQSSRSWRLTAPARSLMAARRRLREIGFVRLLGALRRRLAGRLPSSRDLKLIEASGLFDAPWYLSRYPDVARDGIAPIRHYLQSGAQEGRWPNPLFDTAWYLQEYPDVARVGMNPLVHYIMKGAVEGRDPHPRFDSSAYLERYPDVAAAGLNPLAHFLQHGILEGRQAEAAPTAGPTTILPGARERPDGGALAEDDYLDLSQQIADQRRRQLDGVTPTPVRMIRLTGRDLRAHARGLALEKAAQPQVSIVIPVYNNLTLTLECLTSIQRGTEGVSFEVIVVDDASTDASPDVLPLIENVVYLRNEENLGFLRTCNAASRHARGEFLVLLNNDVQVRDGWLPALLDAFSRHEGVGAAGPKILYPSGRLQEAGSLINPDGSTRLVGLGHDPALPRYNYPRAVDYCSGVCLALRTETFREMGGFDERLAPAYCEDVDLCLRLRARDLRVIYTPEAEIVHHLSATSSSVDPSYKLACVTRNRQQIVETRLEQIEALNQVRLIAFYLPQYHPIPENERWWGKGFTEWTNVARAQPSFSGHYQPRLPADLGFYDLRVEKVMEEQAALAQRYGIHGFCYYYYWFHGQRLLELPLERMLATGKPDLPFCLCWANENWTRGWDGADHEVLIAQEHSDADDEAVIRDLIRYFRHPNYIRIDGRPLFLVYRTELLPDMKRTAEIWRRVCRAEGIGEIYLVNAETFQQSTRPHPPSRFGCDAGVEFPPHESASPMPLPGPRLNPGFTGVVSDYRSLALRFTARDMPGYVRFRTVSPSWDNTPRQPDRAYVFHRSSPGAFQAWLVAAIEDTREQHCGDERIVFLNAWNEWAEGAYLEPDQRFGHGYLEAVRNALEHVTLGPVRSS
jgi:GT2 family glycosyltransferase